MAAATGGMNHKSGLTQKRDDLISAEWPAQFSPGVDTTQHRNSQTVCRIPRLILSNIDQFNQQAMLDKRHQFGLGDFTQMASKGAKQLTFRRHDYSTKK
ncbi:hypothetical protein A1354_21150 [Pseudomonas asplenii]|nr:hypothetical protein A1354_21150 [Pseudomonas asplenii]